MISSTSLGLNDLFVLFIYINMASKKRQKTRWIFQICKDCDHENMKIPKLNILHQISLSQHPKKYRLLTRIVIQSWKIVSLKCINLIPMTLYNKLNMYTTIELCNFFQVFYKVICFCWIGTIYNSKLQFFFLWLRVLVNL